MGSSKLLIYFHANAEDIGLAYPLLDSIRNVIKINVIAPEYPGYGIYNTVRAVGKQVSNQTIYPSSEQIREDSECVYDFVINNFPNIQEKDIIILGRSMGSGPSVHLSSIHEPGALILLSAYTSIKQVVTEKFGYLSALVQEHFDNLSIMDQIRSPTLFIHGK